MKSLTQFLGQLIMEGEDTILLADIFNKYHIHFHGWTDVGIGFVDNVKDTVAINNGTIVFPFGINLEGADRYDQRLSSEKFIEDYKIKKISASQYLGFKYPLSFSGVTFESPEIWFESFECTEQFNKCTFNASDKLVFESNRVNLKFNSIKGKVNIVDIRSIPQIEAKSSKISADSINVNIYESYDYTDIEPIFAAAGISITGKNRQPVVSITDESMIDTLFNSAGDHLWNVKTINIKLSNVEFRRKFGMGCKEVIFTMVKKGSGWVLA